MHRIITPTARIFSAVVILIMGLGIASVFWKMPNGESHHALFHGDIIDRELITTPLPSGEIALLSLEERALMELPMLDFVPVVGGGAEKYAQIYEPPDFFSPEREETIISQVVAIFPAVVETVREERPVLPLIFEPMRQIVEKPIFLETVDKDFQSKPASVSTAEKSDEFLTRFHFAENSLASFGDSVESELPSDPFPMPALQPLTPIHFGNLSPLLPL